MKFRRKPHLAFVDGSKRTTGWIGDDKKSPAADEASVLCKLVRTRIARTKLPVRRMFLNGMSGWAGGRGPCRRIEMSIAPSKPGGPPTGPADQCAPKSHPKCNGHLAPARPGPGPALSDSE